MNPILQGMAYFNRAIKTALPRKIKVTIYSREERVPVRIVK
jgi:hypothetical protein